MLWIVVWFMPLHNSVGVIWPMYTLPYASFYQQIRICLEWWICAERPSAINLHFQCILSFPINNNQQIKRFSRWDGWAASAGVIHDCSWSSPGFIYSSFRWNLQYVDQMDTILQSHRCTFYTYHLFWTDLTIRVMNFRTELRMLFKFQYRCIIWNEFELRW